MRINIPSNPDDIITLAKSILAKHTADAAASPLGGLDMAEFQTLATTADTQQKRSVELYRQAEQSTEARDKAIGAKGPITESTLRHYITASRDVLSGLNKGREHTLGQWGFDVTASVKANGGTPAAAPAK